MTTASPPAPDWFTSAQVLGDMPREQIAARLAALGDRSLGEELRAAPAARGIESFSVVDPVLRFFGWMRTTHICGFLPAARRGVVADTVIPVSRAVPDRTLVGARCKITLDGLHIANYPGLGKHNVLFDFVLEAQAEDGAKAFHYNAKFEAADGETVPVRNFPLFYGLVPTANGIQFGFQTVNVSSSVDEGLLGFLDGADFKQGLSLAASATPLLGQVSAIAASLTRWLAGESRGAMVQNFRQGLDFTGAQFGGALAEGSYLVVQIPADAQHEWSWDDWRVDPTFTRLVRRDDPGVALGFNHLVFGLHRMA